MKRIKFVIVGYGNRGGVYGDFSLDNPDKMEIVAVVDPNELKLSEAQKRYKLKENQLFKDWSSFLNSKISCDIVINSTMDQLHYQTAKDILNAGFDMLIEKPIVPNKDQLIELKTLANKNGCRVFVCHVLRYTPFYLTIKKLLNNGVIGDIMTIEMSEHVGYAHFITSYDRGKWNSEKACGSGFLLAKSCHDLDLISWLNNQTKPTSVVSFANRSQFVKGNKPKGAMDFCYKCPYEDSCPYSASYLYLERETLPFLVWDRINKPLEKITDEEKIKYLKSDIYGRCAYDCGGDIVDRQNILISFENGSLATFNLVGGATKAERFIHIVGQKGEIEGKLGTNKIFVKTIDRKEGMKTLEIDVTKYILELGDKTHSGGDFAIMRDIIEYLNGDRDSISITSLDDSINGHLMVYAAEESRRTNQVVKIGENK